MNEARSHLLRLPAALLAITLTLATDPTGLEVGIDGPAQTAPFTTESVMGMDRELSAPSPLTMGPDTYEFVSWSDGGVETHTISTPTVAGVTERRPLFPAAFRRRRARSTTSRPGFREASAVGS